MLFSLLSHFFSYIKPYRRTWDTRLWVTSDLNLYMPYVLWFYNNRKENSFTQRYCMKNRLDDTDKVVWGKGLKPNTSNLIYKQWTPAQIQSCRSDFMWSAAWMPVVSASTRLYWEHFPHSLIAWWWTDDTNLRQRSTLSQPRYIPVSISVTLFTRKNKMGVIAPRNKVAGCRFPTKCGVRDRHLCIMSMPTASRAWLLCGNVNMSLFIHVSVCTWTLTRTQSGTVLPAE